MNGGNDLPENERSITTVFDKKLIELSDPTKRGYSFAGWFTIVGELVTNESLVNNVCNCSLTVHWIPNKYIVTLDVNRGAELDINTFTVTFDETYGELPTPNRSGFEFIG